MKYQKKCTFYDSPLSVKGHYDLFSLFFLMTDKVTQLSRIGKATILSKTSLSACSNWMALRQHGDLTSMSLHRGTYFLVDFFIDAGL